MTGEEICKQLGVESLMPKGVEHSTPSDTIKVTRSVESLMPKGVEHISNNDRR